MESHEPDARGLPAAVHDMGGREVFYGPIVRDADYEPFHERWEGRVHAMNLLVSAILTQNIDASRYAMERMAPEDYVASPYYGRWLVALEHALRTRGHLAEGELDAILRGAEPRVRGRVVSKPGWFQGFRSGTMRRIMRPMPRWLARLYPSLGGYARRIWRAPKFRVGEHVDVVQERPAGHTRVPGYACGRRGTIYAVHGGMVFPDSNARDAGEQPTYLYGVSFDAASLWPDGEPGNLVSVDLFEPYLREAGAGGVS